MKKATLNDLDVIHKLMSDYFTARLKSGEELSPGELGQINSFLKNNSVVCAMDVEDTPMLNLLEDFKTLDLEMHNGELLEVKSIPLKKN
jgi:hypothetical protein